jgi:hypothetical protein
LRFCRTDNFPGARARLYPRFPAKTVSIETIKWSRPDADGEHAKHRTEERPPFYANVLAGADLDGELLFADDVDERDCCRSSRLYDPSRIVCAKQGDWLCLVGDELAIERCPAFNDFAFDEVGHSFSTIPT